MFLSRAGLQTGMRVILSEAEARILPSMFYQRIYPSDHEGFFGPMLLALRMTEANCTASYFREVVVDSETSE